MYWVFTYRTEIVWYLYYYKCYTDNSLTCSIVFVHIDLTSSSRNWCWTMWYFHVTYIVCHSTLYSINYICDFFFKSLDDALELYKKISHNKDKEIDLLKSSQNTKSGKCTCALILYCYIPKIVCFFLMKLFINPRLQKHLKAITIEALLEIKYNSDSGCYVL